MVVRETGAGVFLHVDDQVLLQWRTREAPIYPSFWSHFGGGVKDRESPEEAAIREVREELALELSLADLTSLGSNTVLLGQLSLEIFFFSAPLRMKLSELRLAEGRGFALFGIEETQQLRVPPATGMALHRHYENLGFG